MIVYHGSIKNFQNFTKETVVQNLGNDINTIGFWFTSDIHTAKPFAIGSETVIENQRASFGRMENQKSFNMKNLLAALSIKFI